MIARKAGAALVVTGVAALAAIPIASGSATHAARKSPKPRTVHVGDYFLSPSKLTVRPRTTIVWKWPSEEGDSHDVALRKRPKGVKRFHSEIAASDYTFKRKLRKRGKYVVICTLHPYDMRMTIRVK